MESLEPSALCATDQANGLAAECMQILAAEIRQRLQTEQALTERRRCFSLADLLGCISTLVPGVGRIASSHVRGSALLRTKDDCCGNWAARRAAAAGLARGVRTRARSTSFQYLPLVLDG